MSLNIAFDKIIEHANARKEALLDLKDSLEFLVNSYREYAAYVGEIDAAIAAFRKLDQEGVNLLPAPVRNFFSNNCGGFGTAENFNKHNRALAAALKEAA